MRDGRAKPRRSSGGVRAAQSAREGVPGRGGPAVLARPSLSPPDRKQPFGGPLLPSKRQERQSPEPRLAEERTGAKAPMEAGGLLAGGPGKRQQVTGEGEHAGQPTAGLARASNISDAHHRYRRRIDEH